MTKSTAGIAVDRRRLVSGMAATWALGAVLPTATQAQTTTASSEGFVCRLRQFAAHDVPPYKDGKPDLVMLFVEMFGLVMPGAGRGGGGEARCQGVLIFDPATNDLVEVIMPFMSKSEVMTLSVDKGWVTRATVRRT